MAAYSASLGVPFVMEVGGGLDMLEGYVQRAPAAWQRDGFEWLYRSVQEPRRMWWRYLKYERGLRQHTDPRFIGEDDAVKAIPEGKRRMNSVIASCGCAVGWEYDDKPTNDATVAITSKLPQSGSSCQIERRSERCKPTLRYSYTATPAHRSEATA